ncbi:MAG TPA: dual specificity protein phosphatase family protein [Verrucomicrobiae bacterium]|nr:dual specificity protein phosphatase family protein [Verrucomicrobiae bacterium]
MPFIHPERRMNFGGGLRDYDDDLPILYSAGVRAVVCLLNIPGDAPVYGSSGFDFLCLPVPDGAPPTAKQVTDFTGFVDKNRSQSKPVAVHCEAGIGRTGTMLAAYLISKGAGAETAVSQVRSVENRAIETPRQIQFLEGLANAWWKP